MTPCPGEVLAIPRPMVELQSGPAPRRWWRCSKNAPRRVRRSIARRGRCPSSQGDAPGSVKTVSQAQWTPVDARGKTEVPIPARRLGVSPVTIRSFVALETQKEKAKLQQQKRQNTIKAKRKVSIPLFQSIPNIPKFSKYSLYSRDSNIFHALLTKLKKKNFKKNIPR